jgi:hypothetical protein
MRGALSPCGSAAAGPLDTAAVRRRPVTFYFFFDTSTICQWHLNNKKTTTELLMKKFLALSLLASLLLSGLALAQVSSPGKSLAPGNRVFEMRIYHIAPGKTEALHSRFRDHTNRLFVKHGMSLIGYWMDEETEKGERLVFILGYPTREARDKSWENFVNDPEWKKAYKESHVDGPLVERVEQVFLRATEYSPIQ